jgi:hypothetical protein
MVSKLIIKLYLTSLLALAYCNKGMLTVTKAALLIAEKCICNMTAMTTE